MKNIHTIRMEIQNAINLGWSRRNVSTIPEAEELQLMGNSAAEFEGCVLYADMKSSTALVNEYKDFFAASIYKAFLVATCDVIANNDGKITSFDGDRVMAIYNGDMKCTNAVKTALQIRFVVNEINDVLNKKYPSTRYSVDYSVGVDVSNLFAIRTGIRNHNDVAWVGSSANIAAKLSEIRGRSDNAFITKRVYSRIADVAKFGGSANEDMWHDTGIVISGQPVYGSVWRWRF